MFGILSENTKSWQQQQQQHEKPWTILLCDVYGLAPENGWKYDFLVNVNHMYSLIQCKIAAY